MERWNAQSLISASLLALLTIGSFEAKFNHLKATSTDFANVSLSDEEANFLQKSIEFVLNSHIPTTATSNAEGNWLHVRVAVLVSVESFQSSVMTSSRMTALNFVGQVFNLVNAIWSQLNTTVHVTRLIIWPHYNAGPEVIRMPPEDWDSPNGQSEVHFKAIPLAENYLWPRLGDSSDYIVIIRNLNRDRSTAQIIGIAARGRTMCQGTARSSNGHGSVVVVSGVTDKNKRFNQIAHLASTVAHELGHTFGIFHDEHYAGLGAKCKCATSHSCIMSAASINPFDWEWSNCSKKAFSYFRPKGNCPTRNPEMTQFQDDLSKEEAICGNGIVEHGEECDCGPDKIQEIGLPPEVAVRGTSCVNLSCCDAGTCKLKGSAKCANGNCCNPLTCNYAVKGEPCRKPKTVECDLKEACDGETAVCRPDRYLMTGSPCFIYVKEGFLASGACYKGECLSRDLSCRKVMGSKRVPDRAASACYALNELGTMTSNCGRKHFRSNGQLNEITKCKPEDAECGNLMCDGYDPLKIFIADDLPDHLKSVTVKISPGPCCSTKNGSDQYPENITCWSMSRNMLPDAGHVRDGMLCAQGAKYCLSHRCANPLPKCEDSPPCDNFGKHVPRSDFNSDYPSQ